MKKIKFGNLKEIENVIRSLKNGESLKLYFEDYGYNDYYKIKNDKVYNSEREIEYDDIEDFIYNNDEIEFSYYVLG